MTLADSLTIASNVAFIFPAAEAIERQYWFEAMIYLAVVLSSSLYHGCNSFANACIGLPPDVLRNCDFFWAQMCIPLIALYAIRPWSNNWYAFKVVAIFSVGVALFFAQRYWGNSVYVQMLVAGVSFGAIFLYWLLYALRQYRLTQEDGKPRNYLPPYRWDYFTLGMGLSGVAVALFAAEMLNHELYWAIHSSWHVDAALGQFFLLCIWATPSEPIVLWDPDVKGNRGQRVPLLQPHPHPYAIPHPPRYNEGSSVVTQRTLSHTTPHSRVVVVVNE